MHKQSIKKKNKTLKKHAKKKKPTQKKKLRYQKKEFSTFKTKPRLKSKRKSKKKKLEKSSRKSKRKARTILSELSLTLGIIFLIVILMNLWVFGINKFEGYSMVPTLNDQDYLFIYKRSKIKRFDLVYIKNATNEVSVRRVIGMPNEKVAYQDDDLYINDELKAERFLTKRIREESGEQITENFDLYDLFQTDVVPQKKYFVLGDNREYSTDSRTYGFVDEKDVIGIVKAKIFPFYDMKQF